jgi:hypothetical protein
VRPAGWTERTAARCRLAAPRLLSVRSRLPAISQCSRSARSPRRRRRSRCARACLRTGRRPMGSAAPVGFCRPGNAVPGASARPALCDRELTDRSVRMSIEH